MNRPRLLSILWAIEFIVGLLPAAILIIVGLVPYLVAAPAVLSLLLKGDTAIVRTAIVLNGTMIGGILGIAALLMGYRPERLRQSAKLKRRAIIFACGGVCAAALYLTSEGLTNVMSNVFSCWIIAGPLLVGAHCSYRVFATPAKAISVVFSISPYTERQRLPHDLRALHEHVVVSLQLGTKVDRHKTGEQRHVDHDRVARIVGSKNQCAGSAFAEVLRHDEEIVLRPRHRCQADVVAEFAGTAGGRLLNEQGVESTDVFRERSLPVGIADHEVPVR